MAPSETRSPARVALVVRAVAGALLAITMTFASDHSPEFAQLAPVLGAIAVGAWSLIEAAALTGLAVDARRQPVLRGTAPLLVLAAAVSAVSGVVLLAFGGSLALLLAVMTARFALVGGLELAAAVTTRRAVDAPLPFRDRATLAGFALLLAAVLALAPPDPTFTDGMAGVFGAVTAVFLGIAIVGASADARGRTEVRP